MCGVFGFITKTGRGPDIGLLKRIATVTQRRGDHAFGLAWSDGVGIGTFKRPGAATDRLSDIDLADGCLAMVGHCRWATHGCPDDNRNNHPHPAGRGWLVHNGVILNHLKLIDRYGLETETDCDSEVLGLLMARFAGGLHRRAALTARVAGGNMAVIGIWARPVRLLVVRDARPLHFGETKHGFYFASLPEGLPGKAYVLKDHKAMVLAHEDRKMYVESFAI